MVAVVRYDRWTLFLTPSSLPLCTLYLIATTYPPHPPTPPPSASKKFMVVYASNQPEQFDWAINDRIDEMVEFRLPGMDERLAMISSYMDKYLLRPPPGSRPIAVEGIDEGILRTVAKETDGYSGREISKLAIAWQAAAYGSDKAVLTAELCMQVLKESRETKVQKIGWLKREQVHSLTSDAKDP